MARCRACNLRVDRHQESCPRCGERSPAKITIPTVSGIGRVVRVALIGGLVALVAFGAWREQSSVSESAMSADSRQNSHPLPAVPPPEPPPKIGALGDRYPEAALQQQAREVDTLLSFVRVAYFAMGCRVFYPDNVNTPGFVDIVINTEYLGLGHPNLPDGAVAAAKRDGMAKASKEGCAYWRQHPEAVQEMRRAQDATLP